MNVCFNDVFIFIPFCDKMIWSCVLLKLKIRAASQEQNDTEQNDRSEKRNEQRFDIEGSCRYRAAAKEWCKQIACEHGTNDANDNIQEYALLAVRAHGQ
jgi:hypothetical protein